MTAARDAIRSTLLRLEDENGRLTAEAVVAEARQEDSPLHGEFDWDVEKAAQAHWLDRARELIRTVRIEVTTETLTLSTVAYVRDPSADAKQQGYVSVLRLRTERDLAHESLMYEATRAAALLQRVRGLALAFGLEKDVDPILSGLESFQQRATDVAVSVQA